MNKIKGLIHKVWVGQTSLGTQLSMQKYFLLQGEPESLESPAAGLISCQDKWAIHFGNVIKQAAGDSRDSGSP